jgi:chromosomal replication initiator protein
MNYSPQFLAPHVFRMVGAVDVIRVIQYEICEKYGISQQELLSERRWNYVVKARQEGYWRAREETEASLPQIAAMFNRLDHTTVMHGIRRHEERIRAENGTT